MMKLKFQEGISKKNRNFRNFTLHTHHGIVGKHLVANSQGKKYDSERFEKLDNQEVETQLNRTNLVNEVAPF